MGLTLAVAPAAEPLTTSEAKLHCRVDGSSDDALITSLIVAARLAAEKECGRALVTQQWVATFDDFPAGDVAIALPLPPLVSVQTVSYVDPAGATQVLAGSEYQVVADGLVGVIFPAYGKSWPITRAQPNAVSVAYTCGYGNAAAVPQTIKQWMLLQIAHWYNAREAATEGELAPTPFVDALLHPYQIWNF